jgi:hypothetical protein
MTNIICYTGGACGDIICGLIDATDVTFSYSNKSVILPNERSRFKKPHTFATIEEKDQYFISVGTRYQSIPSHDLEYHRTRQHSFIGITVSDFDVAIWAATRFKNHHRPHVWDEMTKYSGADTVEKYAQLMIDFSNLIINHTDKTIQLEHIFSGHAIAAIRHLNINPDDQSENIYKNWLALIGNNF